MIRTVLATALAAGLAFAVGTAGANPLKSLYTSVELKDCQALGQEASGKAWLCEGLEGYPVFVAEQGGRMFVSVGAAPERRRAARQSLTSANTLFRQDLQRATIEWRFVRDDGRAVPFATIQRFYTRNGTRNGEVLVVTRVTDKEDCHVAHIDALANDDAIAIARRVADQDARKFDCKLNPRKVGLTGRSPM